MAKERLATWSQCCAESERQETQMRITQKDLDEFRATRAVVVAPAQHAKRRRRSKADDQIIQFYK